MLPHARAENPQGQKIVGNGRKFSDLQGMVPQALRVGEPASPYEWFTMPALKSLAFDLPVMGQE